jgi:AAA+ superfamily predicted ATPase
MPGVSAFRCGESGSTIEAQGLARRTDVQRLSVQFTELIGNESTNHRRTLLLYNSGMQVNQVEDEFGPHVGLHAKS